MLELNKVYCMDCLEGMKQVQDQEIDCIWTDPPYNQNYDYSEYKDNLNTNDYFNLINNVVQEGYRVLKEGRFMFIKQSMKNIPMMFEIINKTDFKFHNLIIWKNSSPAQPKNNYKPSYEVIFMLSKGAPIYFNDKFETRKTIMPWDKKSKENYYGKLSNIWDDISYIYGGSIRHPEGIYKDGTNDKLHPCQHPIQLVIRCIGFVTKEEEVILDPFIGSGTTAISSKRLNRNFIGFEIDRAYVELCNKRLSQKNLDSF